MGAWLRYRRKIYSSNCYYSHSRGQPEKGKYCHTRRYWYTRAQRNSNMAVPHQGGEYQMRGALPPRDDDETSNDSNKSISFIDNGELSRQPTAPSGRPARVAVFNPESTQDLVETPGPHTQEPLMERLEDDIRRLANAGSELLIFHIVVRHDVCRSLQALMKTRMPGCRQKYFDWKLRRSEPMVRPSCFSCSRNKRKAFLRIFRRRPRPKTLLLLGRKIRYRKQVRGKRPATVKTQSLMGTKPNARELKNGGPGS